MILTQDDNGATFTVLRDTEFTVVLNEAPTTGYRWTEPEFENSLITLINDSFLSTAPADTIGGGGQRMFRFKTNIHGTTGLISFYKRSFEVKPPLEIFAITIIIP